MSAIAALVELGIATHRANADFLADGLSGVDVYLVELDCRELGLETLEDRADDLARATPGCPEVDDDDLVLVDLQITRIPG